MSRTVLNLEDIPKTNIFSADQAHRQERLKTNPVLLYLRIEYTDEETGEVSICYRQAKYGIEKPIKERLPNEKSICFKYFKAVYPFPPNTQFSEEKILQLETHHF